MRDVTPNPPVEQLPPPRAEAPAAPPEPAPEPVGETLPDDAPTEPAKPFRNLNAEYTGEIRELLDLWRAVPDEGKRDGFAAHYMEFRKAIPTKPHARNFHRQVPPAG